jgi:SAM-dependent methyltransferase
MHTDIIELRTFYASLLGQLATRSIGMALKPLWPSIPSERLLGIGYAVPWLDDLSVAAERTCAFMPAEMGAVAWPINQPCATALVFDEELPLADNSIDRIIMVHALEHAQDPSETLKEAWRVLAPSGRLVIIVPNRRGVWARSDNTPFGHGRPFSKGQLMRLLGESNFSMNRWNEALLFPPSHTKIILRATHWLDNIGRRISMPFAGVLLVEAQKRMVQGIPAALRNSRRVFIPVLSPQGTGKDQTLFFDQKDSLSTEKIPHKTR